MMMHSRFSIGGVLLLLSLLMPEAASAQRENNIWFFGDRAGIDFNGQAPVPRFDSRMYALEGTASIADHHTGALLFYTDGITVWNRTHDVMRNGYGLEGGGSSTQAALIVPWPGDSTRYLLFSSPHEGGAPNPGGGVVVSVVDMTGDGGKGEVIQRNTPLMAPSTEKLVGLHHCNDTSYWVITHELGNNAFHAFLVGPAGVAPAPVTSRIGTPHAQSPRGWLAASPDGRKLASVVDVPGFVEIFDFDNCTGAISNPVRLLDGTALYGACFSPDNTKLYIPTRRQKIVQIDLSAGYAQTEVATTSRRDQGVGTNYAMQLGPDGRIYSVKTQLPWMGVIEQPNVAGIACRYIDSAFSLDGQRGFTGLPNIILTNTRLPHATLLPFDTIICAGSCLSLAGESSGTPTAWNWSLPGGRPSSYDGGARVEVCYDTPGRYPVVIAVANAAGWDSVTRHITVVGAIPTRTVTAGRREGAPGDTILLPLLLSGGTGIAPGTIRPYRARLRFDPELLLPLDGRVTFEDRGGERLMTVRGSADPAGDTLAMVKMLVLLGDTDRCTIAVDSATWIGCGGALDRVAGEFAATGLCNDGSLRMVRNVGGGSLKVARDRAGRLLVDYRLEESGATRIYLVDMRGQRVATIIEGEREPGSYSAVIERPRLARGRYLCIMETPARLLSHPLLVDR